MVARLTLSFDVYSALVSEYGQFPLMYVTQDGPPNFHDSGIILSSPVITFVQSGNNQLVFYCRSNWLDEWERAFTYDIL